MTQPLLRSFACLVAWVALPLAAAPVTIKLSRTSTWVGGYNGRMVVVNTSGAPLTNWTLVFTTKDKLSFWNQTATVSGTTWTVKPASWMPTIPAGGSQNIDFGATTASSAGWDPWSAATFNGTSVGVENGTTPAVSVNVNPATATLVPGASQAFTATITGSTNTAVAWKASGGTVTTGGVYTAPAKEGTYTVTATSVADTTKNAVATVAVKQAPQAAATLTFTRKSGWAGGYQGELLLQNGGTAPLSGWSLAFDSADALSLHGGTATKSGNTWTVTPNSWTPAIPAGGAWVSSLGATYSTSDWNPPATATLNGAAIPVVIVDQMPSPDGNAVVALFPEFESAARPLNLLTVANGTVRLKLQAAGGAAGSFTVVSNNPELVDVALADGGATLVVTSKRASGGRAGLRIRDTASGKERSVGLRVKASTGAVPGFPDYVSVGVCSEDSSGDLGMFRNFGTGDLNRRADNRYIYLNGGPTGANCWWNWTSVPGDRARTYIRYSQRFGLIPTFVWYNIPDAAENYETDLKHIQDVAYMQSYFDLLKRTLALFNEESKDELIMMVMEPDFIGYMMQQSGKQPSQITAQVMAPLRNAGLVQAGDPTFPDTLEGLVKAINHVVSRDCPQVKFGWQINVWSSPDPLPSGVKTLIKSTDAGWDSGRAFIQAQARKVANYYLASGITYKAHFISFDKYGYDAAGATPGCASDPAPSPWFWNGDHWNNYLFYVKQLHDVTQLPVALWQLPVGRINSSLMPTATGGTFADLTNTTNRYEDSCATYFFGDRFKPGAGNRMTHFSKNLSGDPALKVSGDTVTWGPHFQTARDAGVFNLMFGDGIGDSTRARPKSDPEPTDGWWLMTALQRYLRQPVPLQ